MSGIRFFFILFFILMIVATFVDDILHADNKPLIVGTEATFQPYTFRNSRGELVGYDIDIAKEAANRIGDKLEFKTMLWDDLPAALLSGQIDFIASGMSITDERKKKFAFGASYTTSSGNLIVQKASNLQNRLMKDGAPVAYAWQGLRFGVLANTTHFDWAAKHVPQANIIAFDSIENEYLALANGKIDVLYSDYMQGQEFMAMEGNSEKYAFAGTEIIDNSVLGYGVGFAWRKDDARRILYDDAIIQMLNDSTLDKIGLKYFAVTPTKGLK